MVSSSYYENIIIGRSNLIMEIMEGSYEELTIELKSGDNKGLTRERRRGKSSLSKRPEIHREEPACGPKRNATPKFCMKFAAHKMRIF